jgi:hypothetical protein
MQRARQLPLWLKLVWTAFVSVLVPVYWRQYGPANFLWFSDIAVFLTLVALWWESSLPASMMLLAVGVLELSWNVDFIGALLTGHHLTGLSRYMFDPSIPLTIRGISLFHVVLTPLLVWMVWRLGYDRRALWMQTLLCWIVLPLTYFLTDPAANINSVFGPQRNQPQTSVHPLIYLALLMAFFPLVIYLPTHLLLVWAMPGRRRT